MNNIAIFASGRGSNAHAILNYFKTNELVNIVLIVSNDPEAGVLNLATEYEIPSMFITKKEMNESGQLEQKLLDSGVDLIVLAGFLLLLPHKLIRKFPDKIINIHPALLPKYGGKGMFGHHVHKAVKQSGDQKSGITIHYVNENYDEGKHIFQKSCPIQVNDSAETIANKVLKLEHHYYPRIIEELLINSK